jgi:hypothetical protein
MSSERSVLRSSKNCDLNMANVVMKESKARLHEKFSPKRPGLSWAAVKRSRKLTMSLHRSRERTI